MNSTRRNILIIVIVVLGIAIFFGYQAYVLQQNQDRFSAGVSAYEERNCSDAIAPFAEMTRETSEQAARIAEITVECEIFQDGLSAEQVNNYGTALLQYLSLYTAYEDSMLRPEAAERIEMMIVEQRNSLLRDDICQVETLDTLATFSSLQPQIDDLAFACGQWRLNIAVITERPTTGLLAIAVIESVYMNADTDSDLALRAEASLVDALAQLASVGALDELFRDENDNLSEYTHYLMAQALIDNPNVTNESRAAVIEYVDERFQSQEQTAFGDEAQVLYARAVYGYAESVAESGQFNLPMLDFLVPHLITVVLAIPSLDGTVDANTLFEGGLEANVFSEADLEPNMREAYVKYAIVHAILNSENVTYESLASIIEYFDSVLQMEEQLAMRDEAEVIYAGAVYGYAESVAESGQFNLPMLDFLVPHLITVVLSPPSLDGAVDANTLFEGGLEANVFSEADLEPNTREAYMKYAMVHAILNSENVTYESLASIIEYFDSVLQMEEQIEMRDEAEVIYTRAVYDYAESVLDGGVFEALEVGYLYPYLLDVENLVPHLVAAIQLHPNLDGYVNGDSLLANIFEGDALALAGLSLVSLSESREVIDHITEMITVLDEVSVEKAEVYADAETAYAEAMVIYLSALADQQDIPEIAQPQSISIASNKAVITIQNASPNAIQMILTGTRSYVEALPACPTCQIYTGFGPGSCPNEGTYEDLEVEPGTYTVIVSSQSQDNVTPFQGTWTLEAGYEYPNCFLIVER